MIDVDGHNFPNLALMKISAWHKKQGDKVEFYSPFFDYDKVYMSKVFTFTGDYQWCIRAKEVVKGGTGYGINTVLPYEIEHIYPDYELYGVKEAYGYLTRGCPRGCDFCIVADKEGRKSVKVADLSEFWDGQKVIKLLDPNILAAKEHLNLIQQLVDSKALVDITQGLDARLLTDSNTELLKQLKIKQVHFAWDNYKDKDIVVPKLEAFKKATGWDKRKMAVYVLTNFNSTHQEDLERIYTLKSLGYYPYIMIYDKENLPKGHKTLRLQRWVNNRIIFNTIDKFEDYKANKI